MILIGQPYLPKLPSNIPKFEGKVAEYLANHVIPFHLSCSSNRIITHSIYLCLFKWTLIGLATKCYVDELVGTYTTFEGMAKTFLSFFQLPVRYGTGLDLLAGLF